MSYIEQYEDIVYMFYNQYRQDTREAVRAGKTLKLRPTRIRVFIMIDNILFEIGNVLLKAQLSKNDTKEILQHQIDDDEKILFQKLGKFWNQQNIFDRPDGLVVLTTHRLVFLSKVETITTKTDWLSFPYECISNLKSKSIWFVTPAIQFDVEGKKFVFTFFPGVNTEEIINVMNEGK